MKCVNLCFWFCCILALVVGQLKPIEENEEENQMLLGVISHEASFGVIKNFITYFGNQELGQGNTIAASFQQRLMETFNLPVIVAGSDIGHLRNIISDRSLAVVFFNSINDPILDALPKSLDGLTRMRILFIYKVGKDLAPTTTFLEVFFRWCYSKNFVNMLLLYKYNDTFDIWSYEMRAEIQIFKYSESFLSKARTQGLRKIGNMGQYRSLVAVYQSVPDAFVYKSSDTPGNNVTLYGYIGLLLEVLMCYVNATMDLLPLPYDEYVNAIAEGRVGDRFVDIGANLVPELSADSHSPIVMATETCLVLPHDDPYTFSFFGQHYTIFVFLVVFTIVNTVIKRLANPHTSLGALFYRSFRLSMMQTVSSSVFHRLGLPEKFIEVFTQMYNMLVTSLFISYLSTAFIAGLQKPKIVDTETFLASGLQIMVATQHMEGLFERLPSALSERVLEVDLETLEGHLGRLNDSYAYVMETPNWMVIQYMQQRLHRPKLRLAPRELCSVQRYMRFYVRSGLSLLKVLTPFVGQAKELGLTDKWLRLGIRQMEQLGMISRAPYDPADAQPLSIVFYANTFALLACGLILALLVFLLEFVYSRWNNKRNNIIIL